MIKKILLIGLVLLFLGTYIAPSVAIDNVKKSPNPIGSEKTLYVGGSGPGNYTKIQEAIDNSSDGDTVFVFIGTYFENIRIDRDINLIGENKETTIIDAKGVDTAVEIA